MRVTMHNESAASVDEHMKACCRRDHRAVRHEAMHDNNVFRMRD